MIVGIDPGFTGAIALLNDKTQYIEELIDMPVLVEGKNKRLNTIAIADTLRTWNAFRGIDEVRLERVNARPPAPGKNGKQRTPGTQSSFNFGRGFGALEGVIGALGLRLIYAEPRTWKQRARLIGKDKDVARTRALELYPQAELHRKKDVGRADAILIATYGGQQ